MKWKKLSYFAVFEENKDGAFGVYFPDISGCISFGETLEKAQENAKEALKLHVYGLEKYGEQLPASSEKLDSNDIKKCIVMPISIYPDLIKYEMNNRRVVGDNIICIWITRHLGRFSVVIFYIKWAYAKVKVSLVLIFFHLQY